MRKRFAKYVSIIYKDIMKDLGQKKYNHERAISIKYILNKGLDRQLGKTKFLAVLMQLIKTSYWRKKEILKDANKRKLLKEYSCRTEPFKER